MIIYNEIYEASERHPLVSLKLPQNTERQFLNASGEIASMLQGEKNDNL